jgi:DNA-binding response OmpR family regulator
MSCHHCERKDAEIARLVRELDVRRRDGEIGALMSRFGMTAAEAKVVLLLYRGNGRIVGHDSLLDIIDSNSPESLKVIISRAREKLGQNAAIHNEYGVGYALNATACSRVMAALEPPEMQSPITA